MSGKREELYTRHNAACVQPSTLMSYGPRVDLETHVGSLSIGLLTPPRAIIPAVTNLHQSVSDGP